jgi:hypothetical protein
MSATRRALIVANSDYPAGFGGLVSPARDAQELARVLGDPSIGGFEVTTLLNQGAGAIGDAIDVFFNHSGARHDDLLLLYFSGHGVTVEDGRLYLAAADSQFAGRSLRRATAVAAEFIDATMLRSRSRRQILVLDCCHSGAFAEGMRVRGELPALDSSFTPVQGMGRIVLTACTERQFAFEGQSGEADQPSVYTHFLVKGLETGEADHGDGEIDVDELHDYLVKRLREAAPYQTPTKSGYVEGQLYIARTKVVKPAELPRGLLEALDASDFLMRLGAVTELEGLLRGEHPGRAFAAYQELAKARDTNDSFKVRAAAKRCLIDFDARNPPPDNTRRADPPRPRPETTDSPGVVSVTVSRAELGQSRVPGGDEAKTARDGTWYRHRDMAALAAVAVAVVVVPVAVAWAFIHWLSHVVPPSPVAATAAVTAPATQPAGGSQAMHLAASATSPARCRHIVRMMRISSGG